MRTDDEHIALVTCKCLILLHTLIAPKHRLERRNDLCTFDLRIFSIKLARRMQSIQEYRNPDQLRATPGRRSDKQTTPLVSWSPGERFLFRAQHHEFVASFRMGVSVSG